jgi:hypothetical protein
MKSLLRLLPVRIALTVLFACCHLPEARAGGSADSRVGVEKYGDEAIRNLTLKLNDELDHRHVNVALVARAGRLRSEMPKGINYTHVAFVVFEPVKTSEGTVSYAYTVYNLYQGADGRDDRSYLKQDLTYDFVAGTAEPDIAVCVPNEVLQRRILAVLRSPAYRALHIPEYNIVANPWVDRFDNCVTHSLKICVAAIYQTDDRARIYRDIREYFHPTHVRLGPVQSLGSNFIKGMSRADMDRSGLQTATYDSLKDFLAANGLMQESFRVTL